ncbi:hypothetical protein ACH4SP_00585 [Streptomyces sp. NPDC021093]|uniref:hypothetical protein n=1 Tax=Streptomyces sp. NPDC021093 TaxID=3365112 RepID=UPI00379B7A9C
MKRPHRLPLAFAAILGMVATGPAATASEKSMDEPRACISLGTKFYVKRTGRGYTPVSTVYRAGPAGPGGGSVTGSAKKAITVSASTTLGGELAVKSVVAEAKAKYESTSSRSYTSEIQLSVTLKVRPGRYGHMQYVVWVNKLSVSKELAYDNCPNKVVATGTARVPFGEGWRTWETSH